MFKILPVFNWVLRLSAAECFEFDGFLLVGPTTESECLLERGALLLMNTDFRFVNVPWGSVVFRGAFFERQEK
jgi:hypothetical protein